MVHLQNSNPYLELHLLKTFLINLIGWIVIIIAVVFFAVYRKVIDIILKIKHGALYGGLFNLNDGVFFWSDVAPPSLTTVLYIKSKNQIDLLTNVRKVVAEKIFKNPDLYPKLTGTKYSFGGYAYWMKYGCKPDTAVKALKLPASGSKFNEEYLKKAAAEIVEAPNDENNAVLWKFYISQKPLEDFNSDGSYCYPIIARFHHSIADGTSLVALFIRLFGDTTAQNYSEELFRKLFKPISHHHKKSAIESLAFFVKRCIKTFHFWLDLTFFALGRIVQNCQLRAEDDNALHSSQYSGEKITTWATENESHCLSMVKRIKDRTASKVTCVLSTAISASMTQYFKRNNFPVPEYTSGVMALLLDFPSIDSSKPAPLDNKAAGLSFELPSHTSNTVVDSLQNVTAAMNNRLKYTDAVVSSLLLRYIMGYFPIKLIDNYLGYDAQTFLLTNIPGGSKIAIFNGCSLEKVVPIAPNVKGIGISFGIISYDNTLQVGVTVDKALISNPEEVQRIADDFFHTIRVLDIETKNKC